MQSGAEVCQTVAREFLPARGAPAAPADLDEIRRALRSVGYYAMSGRGDPGADPPAPPFTVAVLDGDRAWKGNDAVNVLPGIYGTGGVGGDVYLVAPDSFLSKVPIRKKVEEYGRAQGRRLLLFPYDCFATSPLKHHSVPPHYRVSAAEQALIMRTLHAGGTPSQIYETDPVAVWIGARLGELVEIWRPSEAGVEIAYRLVRRGRVKMG